MKNVIEGTREEWVGRSSTRRMTALSWRREQKEPYSGCEHGGSWRCLGCSHIHVEYMSPVSLAVSVRECCIFSFLLDFFFF